MHSREHQVWYNGFSNCKRHIGDRSMELFRFREYFRLITILIENRHVIDYNRVPGQCFA